jgi:hypothetical protein
MANSTGYLDPRVEELARVNQDEHKIIALAVVGVHRFWDEADFLA